MMGNDIQGMWNMTVDPLNIFGLLEGSVGKPYGQGLINGSMGASRIMQPTPGRGQRPQAPAFNTQGLWGFMGNHPLLQGRNRRQMYQPQQFRQGLM